MGASPCLRYLIVMFTVGAVVDPTDTTPVVVVPMLSTPAVVVPIVNGGTAVMMTAGTGGCAVLVRVRHAGKYLGRTPWGGSTRIVTPELSGAGGSALRVFAPGHGNRLGRTPCRGKAWMVMTGTVSAFRVLAPANG